MEENNQPHQVQVNQSSWFQKVDPRTNIKGVVVLLVVIILFGGAIAWNSERNSSKKETEQQKQSTETKFLADNSVVYGYWVDKNSVIESVDLSTSTNSTLAVLPNNIKQVSVVSDDNLIFIKDTDASDYGKSVVSYRISDSTENVISTTDSGYGIDLYVVSPNGKYIAIWEISPAPNSSILSGGRSRVYSVDISKPGSKNLIYDEAAPVGIAVHYPVGITDNGEIFMDKFLPNSGVGWAYGMSMSNFTGSVKSEIASMANGTYSSQPIISPDGGKILFIGYDGSKGDGVEIVNGYRRASVTPNTIEVFDTNTKIRTKLVSGIDGIYQKAQWDLQDGNIIYASYDDKTGRDINKYYFDTHSSKKVDLPEGNRGSVRSSLQGGSLLLSESVLSDSALGNLGFSYEPSISSLSVFTPKSGSSERVSLNGGYVQFIALKGSKYFKTSNLNANKQANKSINSQGKQLQLETFAVKPTLAPVREINQSQPPQQGPIQNTPIDRGCGSDLLQQQCAGLDTKDGCFIQSWTDADGTSGSCYRSPLYLYGQQGVSLNVSVGTPIFSTNVLYLPQNGFDITLLSDGKFRANGSVVESISFDYTSAIRKLSRPSYGKIVKLSDLKQTIKEYSEKLGFNQKETEDSVMFAKEITSPYVYVSFYDDNLSKQILPLYFSIHPDTYRNIVFYFEQFETKPNLSPKPPVFDPIVRFGFTAIEISSIVR